MDVLTRETPKPALPFAGAFRLIDVPLSNLRNSGISDVWVSVQYLGQVLTDVMANGKPWDLDRHHGGFRVIMPEQAGPPSEEGFVSGNAEELLSNRDAIRRHGADAVLVLSADHVYRLDYAEVVAEHLRRGAECTVVTTEVALADADAPRGDDHRRRRPGRAGRLQARGARFDDGGHRGLRLRPDGADRGPGGAAPEPCRWPRLRRAPDDNEPEDGSALGDFGEHLLPAMIERGRTYGYPLAGYWRDLGRPETYLAAHRELLAGEVSLFAPDWPITTTVEKRAPARLHRGCSVADSMIADGCEIFGSVRNSVLGPGVVVEAGGQVRDSVIFADVTVRSAATVDWSIVDRGTEIGTGAKVGNGNPQEVLDPELLALLGADCRIAPGAQVPRGSRLEPGTIAD